MIFKNKDDLQSLIREELIRRNLYSPFWRQVLTDVKQMYYPSKASTVGLLFVTLSVFLVEAYFNIPVNPLHIKLAYDSFIPILTGITAFLFALIIFISSFFSTDNNLGRVLLKESKLYPLVSSTVIFFILLSIDKVNDRGIKNGTAVVLYLLGIFTIYSLYKTLSILLNPQDIPEQQDNLLEDVIKRNLNNAVTERLGNNLLVSKLERGRYSISYQLLKPFEDDYQGIILRKEGYVENIHFKKLYQLVDMLERSANELNKTFKKDSEVIVEKRSPITDFTEPGSSELKSLEKINLYITKGFRDHISQEWNEVFYLPREILRHDSSLEERIEDFLCKAYELKSDNYSLNKKFSKLLTQKRDKAIESIRNNKIYDLDETLETYNKIIHTFLEVIDPYSSRDANAEMNSFWGRWKEIDWIINGLTTILKESIHKSLKIDNLELLSSVWGTVIKALYESIRYKDHLIFKTFVSLYLNIYETTFESDKEGSNPLKSKIYEDMELTLNEILRYKVNIQNNGTLSNLEENSSENLEFILDVIQLIQELMKRSFDKRDRKNFIIFTSILNTLQSPTYSNLLISEQNKTDEGLKQKFEKVANSVNQVIFGIGSWILNGLKNQEHFNIDKTDKSIFEFVLSQIPNDIDKLMTLYKECRRREVESFWGWDLWTIRGNPSGIAVSINAEAKLDFFFCVKALSLINDQSEIKVDIDSDLHCLIDTSNAPVMLALDNIRNNIKYWTGLVPQIDKDKIEKFYKLLDNLNKKYNIKEEERIIKSTLLKSKKANFIYDLKNSYSKNIVIKELFRKYNNLKFLADNQYSIPLGVNEIVDKEIFLESHIDYGNIGSSYGTNLAHSENIFLYQKIQEVLPLYTEDKDLDLETRVNNAVKELQIKGYKPSVILFNRNPYDPYLLHTSLIKLSYKDNAIYGLNEYQGTKNIQGNDIDTFAFYDFMPPSRLIVVDLAKLGILNQYKLKNIALGKPDFDTLFNIGIKDLNKCNKLRQSIISQNNPWLSDIIDKETYLRQKVLICIYEKLRLEIRDKDAGFIIDLNT